MDGLTAPPFMDVTVDNLGTLTEGLPALFLDVDGTILDLAERPDDVVTPPGLVTALLRTERKLAGGLALVSGRPIHELDRLFEPLRLRASGVHGAEMRFEAGGPPISALGARRIAPVAFRGSEAGGCGVSGRVRREQALSASPFTTGLRPERNGLCARPLCG